MKSLLNTIAVSIIAIAAGVLTASGTWIVWDAWKSSDLEAFRALVGGFTGAFFAYLFVRFGDALKKLYDRKEANHTALVKLQHYFNDCMNATNDNIFIVDDCARVFNDECLGSNQARLYGNRFHLCTIDRENIANLTNVDFVNEVSSLNARINKANHSIESIDRNYALFRDALLAKTIDTQTYLVNARQYRDRCLEMRPFLQQLLDDLVRLFAVANLLLRNRPFFLTVQNHYARTSYTKRLRRELDKELPRVKAEIAALAEASANRIREAQQ